LETITVKTAKPVEVIDITGVVERLVAESGVKEGMCLVFVPHATAAIILNENEPNLLEDYVKFFEQVAPKKNWAHNSIDNNAEAHLKSALFGQSKTIPISDKTLVRGTWQQILLCEFDGPRDRKVTIVCR
jgi:secondary thiamine-phosphate synthase enzyme